MINPVASILNDVFWNTDFKGSNDVQIEVIQFPVCVWIGEFEDIEIVVLDIHEFVSANLVFAIIE